MGSQSRLDTAEENLRQAQEDINELTLRWRLCLVPPLAFHVAVLGSALCNLLGLDGFSFGFGIISLLLAAGTFFTMHTALHDDTDTRYTQHISIRTRLVAARRKERQAQAALLRVADDIVKGDK